MKKASVDDYIKNILNSSSLDNEMKLSFQRKKAANNQQTNEHTKPVPSTGKYAPQIPLWATNESYVPALFKNIRKRVTRENGHLDTNGIYTIFLSSGLPNTVLGLVWNCVNRTLPGELLPHELNLGLALLGVIQHQMRQGLCNNPQWSLPTIEQLCQLKDAPIPQLSLPASVAMSQQPVVSHSTTLSSSTTHVPPASTPQLNVSTLTMATTSRTDSMSQASHPPSVMSPPDLAPPSYETALSMMKTGASALTQLAVNEDDDFGDFASSRVPVSANTSLAMPSVSSQSGSSPSLSNAPAVTQSGCDFFSAPPNPDNSSDWADFTSFQTATSSSTNQNPSTADVKAMPLSVKLPFNITAPAASKTTPTVSTSFSTEEVDLPLSVEKHETVDRYAALRDELADFDHSSSGSDEITTSPSGCDPASISSSRSSTNNDIHWTNTQIRVNKSVDSEAPSFSRLDDEFTDFRGAVPPKLDGGSSTHHSQHLSQQPDEFGEFKQSDGPPAAVQQSPAAHLQSVLQAGQSVSQSQGTSPTSNISALNSIISSISSNDREKKATNSSKFDLIDSIFKSVAKPSDTSADRNAVDGDGDEFGSFSSAKMESRVESVVEHQSGTVEHTFTSPSANRYDCILEDETICDAYEKEWLRCLERCYALLQEAEILLDEIIEKGLLNEVLDTKKGNSYIQGLTEVYSVSLRISQAQNAFDVVNNKLHETIGSIKSVWTSLIIKCPKLSIDLKELLGSIVPDKSMNEKELCGICLNSVSNSKLAPSVLIYGTRHYHCSCANFWVNCLDLTLPQLTKPHLI